MQTGRKEIFTDYDEITEKNLIEVLQNAMISFTSVASECNFLLEYEAGNQPIAREKNVRSDIDCHCIDNIANEIVEFKLGFNWGHPITLIQDDDKKEITEEEIMAISSLNKCYQTQKIKSKTQELARFIEICGIGYTIVDINTDWKEGDSYFNIDVLDPRNAFVIKTNRLGKKPVLGVTFRKSNNGNYYFTCFTDKERYEVINLAKIIEKKVVEEEKRDWEDKKRWKHNDKSGEKNPLDRIPITEWIKSHDRMGCFERQLSEMDNLNLLISDFTNDVEQNTQAIWHGNDIEFPKDENGNELHPESGEWLVTQTTADGKQPYVKPLAVTYDYQGMLSNIITRRSLILQKCNVPQRNDNSGGSTGVAMSDATGWSAAETSASKEQNVIEGCKMEEVKSALAAIGKSEHVKQNDSILILKYSDLMPNIKRQKTYELAVKTNAIATLLGHGFSLEDVVSTIPLFEDPNQVCLRSGKSVKKYQKSVFDKSDKDNQSEGGIEEKKPNSDRLNTDESDQIENSPNIDGMKTE